MHWLTRRVSDMMRHGVLKRNLADGGMVKCTG